MVPSVVRLATLGELQLAHPAVDGPGMLLVRPEALRILGADGAPNTVTATVRETRCRGTHRTVVAVTGRTTPPSPWCPPSPVEPGDASTSDWPPDACRVLPKATPRIDPVTTSENEEARA